MAGRKTGAASEIHSADQRRAVSNYFPATTYREINMTYAIMGAGLVGATLARFFAAKKIPVLIANSRGPETLGKLTAELGASVKAVTVGEAVEANIILVAVGAIAFKDVGALMQDWSGKIVIDVTNGFMLPPEVRRNTTGSSRPRLTRSACEEQSSSRPSISFHSRSSPAHCPTMSVEGSCSFRVTMRMQARPLRSWWKALALRRSKSARLQKAVA